MKPDGLAGDLQLDIRRKGPCDSGASAQVYAEGCWRSVHKTLTWPRGQLADLQQGGCDFCLRGAVDWRSVASAHTNAPRVVWKQLWISSLSVVVGWRWRVHPAVSRHKFIRVFGIASRLISRLPKLLNGRAENWFHSGAVWVRSSGCGVGGRVSGGVLRGFFPGSRNRWVRCWLITEQVCLQLSQNIMRTPLTTNEGEENLGRGRRWTPELKNMVCVYQSESQRFMRRRILIGWSMIDLAKYLSGHVDNLWQRWSGVGWREVGG